MKQLCKIILVRHGESLYNKRAIIGGDSPLTDKGRLQAKEAKKILAGIKFDAVYSSDMDRAIETAAIISGKDVPKNHRLPGLTERKFGSLEGESYDVHRELEHTQRIAMTHEQNLHFKYVPDIESDHELGSRFVEALRGIAEENPGKTVLVAAHGGAIRTTLMRLQDITYNDLPQGSFKNAGYIELDYQSGEFKVTKIVSA